MTRFATTLLALALTAGCAGEFVSPCENDEEPHMSKETAEVLLPSSIILRRACPGVPDFYVYPQIEGDVDQDEYYDAARSAMYWVGEPGGLQVRFPDQDGRSVDLEWNELDGFEAGWTARHSCCSTSRFDSPVYFVVEALDVEVPYTLRNLIALGRYQENR